MALQGRSYGHNKYLLHIASLLSLYSLNRGVALFTFAVAMAAILESKFPLMVAKVNNATIAHLSRDRSREGGL